VSTDVDELARDVRRVSDRLRSLDAGRAEAHAADVRRVLQVLADAAAALESAPGAPAPERTVPELPVAALGDQLDVLGTDLIIAARSTRRDPGPDAVLAEAAAALRDLRLAL
jgi:hypothetical protein